MEKKTVNPLLIVAFGVALFAALMNLNTIFSFLEVVYGILSPVLIGFLVAFILNVPMSAFEKLFLKITRKWKKQPSMSFVSLISLVLSIICVLLVIVILVTALLPAVISSVKNVYSLFVQKWPEYKKILADYNINTESITLWIESVNADLIIQKIFSADGAVINSAVSLVSNAISSIVSFIVALIIGMYVLLSKRQLARQSKKLLVAHLKESQARYVVHVATLTRDAYSKFLSGQCVEAFILGVLMFVVMSIFGIPYAALTGVLAAVMSFIPYVGAAIACGIGALLVAIASPQKIILCIGIYLVVQFVETQFIYPHVVGTSVGLSPLWTLVAVIIGGELMGLFGIIFFIPLVAVSFELLREHTNKLIEKKQLASRKREVKRTATGGQNIQNDK